MSAIKMLHSTQDENFKSGIRTVLYPHNVNLAFMEEMSLFALKNNMHKITFSSIIPAGKAGHNSKLLINKQQEENFIKNIYVLQNKYQMKDKFLIRTKDPLKFIQRGYSDVSKSDKEIIFDGCGAGVVSLNFKYDGYLYPCALLDYKLFNFKGKNVSEIETLYKNNEFVKNMIGMKLTGKCGKCNYKYQCGGCRARALYYSGNVMGEDPKCFL